MLWCQRIPFAASQDPREQVERVWLPVYKFEARRAKDLVPVDCLDDFVLRALLSKLFY